MDRTLHLPGAYNARDLGGLPIEGGATLPRGRFFRSDALFALTDEGGDLLLGAGVTDVVDLRATAEVERKGADRLPGSVTCHHLPIVEGGADPRREQPVDMISAYAMLLDFAGPNFVRVLDRLSRAPGGGLFHCSAGKDRAGLVAALTLGLLGTPDEIIVADYELTAMAMPHIMARVKDLTDRLPKGALEVHGETMRATLRRVRENHGGVEAFLRDHGMTDDTVVRLRQKAGLR